MTLTPTRLSMLATILTSLAVVFAVTMPDEKGDYEWMKPRLDVTKAYTLEVIKAMPDEHFDFKPTEAVRSFKAQTYHIVYSLDYFNRVFKGNPQAAWSPGDEESKGKEELIIWAEEQFDAIHETILTAANNDQLTAGILSYLDHNAHHRGQMITYLRMKDITPPSYR